MQRTYARLLHLIIAITTIIILMITITIILVWKRRTLELGKLKRLTQGHPASSAARFHAGLSDSKLNCVFTMLSCPEANSMEE